MAHEHDHEHEDPHGHGHGHGHGHEHAHGQVEDEEEPLDREAEIRKRLALAQIRQYPDPVLRMHAAEVTEFDDALRKLVGRMQQLMRDARGIGLAATQVGVLQRLFVFDASEAETVALVNPKIVVSGAELETDEEGCLSLQGVLVPVERPTTVVIEGRDETGADVRYELEGLTARCVQHEFDHLDGVLIIDRTTREGRREALAKLRPQPVLRSV